VALLGLVLRCGGVPLVHGPASSRPGRRAPGFVPRPAATLAGAVVRRPGKRGRIGCDGRGGAAITDGLKRSLGLGGLAFYGIGLILGAGIYSILGSAAGKAGDALWMSFLLGSAAAFLTGLSYAELASMIPKAGAEYIYAGEAWPSAGWLRFCLGLMLAAASTATATTVSLAFAGYWQLFLSTPEWLIAALLLAAVAGLNLIGIQQSSWVNTVFTLAEAGGLVAVIAVGLNDPDFGKALFSAPSAGVLSGASLVFFAYLGFEDIANLAEETRDPGRNVPRAILLAVVVSTSLYVLVALASVALLEVARLAGSDSPLADAVREGAPRLAGAVGGVALFATANTALISVLAGSRVIYGMAEGGDLPPVLSGVLPRRGTPGPAIVAVLAGALLLLPLGTVAVVGSVASLAALLAFVAVNAALIRLRFLQPEKDRPFRVPFHAGRLPLLPVAGALLAALLITQFDAVAYAVVMAVIVGALLLYMFKQRVVLREGAGADQH
jgi:amino acid transporter